MEAEATEVPRREAAPPPAAGGLDSFFKLTERGTTVGREMRAGLATFMVMAYIIFVNANILSAVPASIRQPLPAGTAPGGRAC